MFSFLSRMSRRWRNRPSKYREAGKLDGKRGIPHLETDELPERLQQLEKFGNQEISHLAEESSKKRSGLQSLRKTLVELFGADQKAHSEAMQETGQRQTGLNHSGQAYFAIHRKHATHSGIWPKVWMVVFNVFTVAADYPLNLAAFSQLAENESVTQMMALIFSAVLMMVAHVIGALFRSDNPAAKWTGGFLASVSMGFVVALAWLRKGTIMQVAAQTFTTLDPAFVFVFYVCLQVLIFALAVVIGYALHEPMQADFDKKVKSVKGGKKTERKAHMKMIATGQALQTAVDSERNADHVYVHRDQQLRDRIEELRAIYLRANRAARTDLEDGKLPKAYTKPLTLIRPQALEDAQNRINGRPMITAA